ncbi:S-Ena type endospore appendage [Fredinandcohnia sp. 179-A 10B2 NHS]|uniref:S-Ena type endospore appendage n=1 Tax=Fredinandcohnia sp. 179-A 10B2 NHS TaxID=3235176 RepID=UPI0039A174E6
MSKGNESSKKKKCKEKNKDKHITVEVKLLKDKEDSVLCSEICGNVSLNEQVSSLDIWEEYVETNTTLFVSVFNQPNSSSNVRVLVNRKDSSSLEFTVPPGNTGSGTVDNAELVQVFRIGEGFVEGRYCLDVCVPSKENSNPVNANEESLDQNEEQ